VDPGTLTIGTFPDNEPFNLAQIGANTVSAGVGASGTGTLRVASLIHDGTDTALVTATSGGSLQVECTNGCSGSGGTSHVDDNAFTVATDDGTVAFGIYRSVRDAVTDNDAGALAMTETRGLYTTLESTAGVAAFGAAGTAAAPVLTVQGIASMTALVVSATNLDVQSNGGEIALETTLSTLSTKLGTAAALADNTANPTLGGIASFEMCWDGATWDRCPLGAGGVGIIDANTSRITIATDDDVSDAATELEAALTTEDFASATADPGLVIFAIRDDTLDIRSGTEGDFEYLHTNANGALWIDAVDLFVLDTTVTTIFGSDAIFGTAGSADTDVLSIQGIASMTPLLTNPGTAENWGIYLEDGPETAGGNLMMAGAVRRDTAATSATTAGDNATVNVDQLGRMWTRFGDPCADYARITRVAVNQATSGNNDELVGEQSGQIVYLCGFGLVTDGAVEVQFIGGTGTDCGTGETDLTGPMSFAANGGISVPNGGVPQFATAASSDLCLELSGAVEVNGWVAYVQTAAP
jgi:hypothetical protein